MTLNFFNTEFPEIHVRGVEGGLTKGRGDDTGYKCHWQYSGSSF